MARELYKKGSTRREDYTKRGLQGEKFIRRLHGDYMKKKLRGERVIRRLTVTQKED